MTRALRFYRSTIGKKIIMAVTGILLVGFLISHVAANLLVFQGPGALDAYAAFLRSTGKLLWIARAGLLLAVVLHIDAAIQLTLRGRQSRPVGYARQAAQASTLAARTMRMGGLLLLVFIVYHLLDFTVGATHPSWPDFDHATVHANVVEAFRSPVLALFYVLTMAVLALHLQHGMYNMVLTLGLENPRYVAAWRNASWAASVLVALGFASIPVAVYAGVVQ